MGSNTLGSVSDGQIIQSSQVEQYKTALTSDILPRNLSGVVTDNAGSLGSYTYIWNSCYASTYRIGSSSANNYIQNSDTSVNAEMDFYIQGVRRFQITELGIDGSQLHNLSVDTAKLANLSVTNGKIASNAITNIKIDNDTIENNKIQIRTLTREKMCNVYFSEDNDASGSRATPTLTLGSDIDFNVSVQANDTILTDSNTIIKPIIVTFTTFGSSASWVRSAGGVSYIYLTRKMPGGSESLVATFQIDAAYVLPSSSFMYVDTSFTAGQYLSTGLINYYAYFRTAGTLIDWSNVRMLAFPIK